MSTLQFSETAQREIADLLTRYPTRQAASLPVLHIAQREFGYISREAEQLVAETLDLPPIAVENLVTFYTMFHRAPVGKYVLYVCHTLSCALCGAADLAGHLKRRLGIDFGQTTGDGLFSLRKVECLGSCGTAPVMQVNDRYHENLTVEKVDALLADLRNGQARSPAAPPGPVAE